MQFSSRAALSAALVLTCSAGAVRAQPSVSNETLAQSLFEDGRRLMQEKKYADACPKLAESHRLDPAGGTLLNLAICHEREGKTATAWAEYKDAASQARRDGRADREEIANRQLALLEPMLSKVTVKLADGVESDGLEIQIDGAMLGSAAVGTAMPIDPGSHALTASRPGHESWRHEFTVGERADRKLVTVPELPPSVAKTPVTPEVERGSSDMESDGSGQRMTGYVLGGVGVVGLAVGSYFGLQSFSKWDERNSNCTDGVCNADAVAAKDDAGKAANLSNVGFGVGILGLGIGTYLILTAGDDVPSREADVGLRVEPAVGPQGGGVQVGGAW